MAQDAGFFNLYNHNFVRLAAAIPRVRVANPAFNAEQTIGLMREAASRKALARGLPGARPCGLLVRRPLPPGGAPLRAASTPSRQSLEASAEHTRHHSRRPAPAGRRPPFQLRGRRLRGKAPRRSSRRPTCPITASITRCATSPRPIMRHRTASSFSASDVPFGTRLVFETPDQPDFRFFVEVCEDLWVPIPPSSYAALAGATVLVNLSGSNITVGKAGLQAAARREPVGAVHRRLSLHVGRLRRIDDRPRVGRPGHDLRERDEARRIEALLL